MKMKKNNEEWFFSNTDKHCLHCTVYTAILFPLLLLLPSLKVLTLFKHLLSKKAIEPIPRIWLKDFMGLGANGGGGGLDWVIPLKLEEHLQC